MKKTYLLFLLLCCVATISYGQAPDLSKLQGMSSEQLVKIEAVRSKIRSSGFSESQVQEKLKAKGFSVNDITPTNVNQMEAEVDIALQELAREKSKQSVSTETATNTGSKSVEAKLKEEASATENVTNTVGEIVEEKLREEINQAGGMSKPNGKGVVQSAGADVKEATQNIKENIKEGQGVDEAISNEIIEQDDERITKSSLYGAQLFREKGLKVYKKTEDVRAPDSYLMGVGDEVNISLWGDAIYNSTFVINKDGYIQPDRMPRINLKGMTLAKAREYSKKLFSRYYPFHSEDFSFTINHSRTVTVNVYGEATNYGGFTVPAINTAFNVLMAAGGPSEIGSVRNIELLRGGEKARRMDIYEFMLNPSIQEMYYLLEGDIIYIPVAKRIISISGAVKRPARYELLDNENLNKLIEFAGGINDNAYATILKIKRFQNEKEIIIDVNYTDLKAKKSDFALLPGDVVSLGNIPKAYENFINISGAVTLPRQYELTPNMKVKDLVDKATLLKEARNDVAIIQHVNTDGTSSYERLDLKDILENPNSTQNIALKSKDKLTILTQSTYTDKYQVGISGHVRSPKKYPFDPQKSLKVEDLVLLAGGLKVDATDFAYIKRYKTDNNKLNEYIKINIKNALANPTSEDNKVLEPGDEVIAYSNLTYTDAYNISVSGSVRNPGKYQYNTKSLKVDDLVLLAGGLKQEATDFAYIKRYKIDNSKLNEYIRIDVKNAIANPTSADNKLLEPRDELVIFSKLSFTDVYNLSISGAVRSPGEYQYHAALTLKDILTLAGGLKLQAATNRVEVSRIIMQNNQPTKTVVATVEVDRELNMVTKSSDFKLQPFDQIIVRAVPEFNLQRNIRIEGEVMYPGTYALIDNNEQLSSVIARAGGLTEEAFKGGTTLFRQEDNIGYIIMNLEEAEKSPKSSYNYVLRQNDLISIPKIKDFVTIRGATRANEIYNTNVVAQGKLNVPYVGRRAMFYIDKYAAGVNDNGSKKEIIVLHPNGELKRTKNFLFFKVYPKIRKGSIVTVGNKPVKTKEAKEGEKKSNVDWDKITSQMIATLPTMITLLALLRQLGN
ncbi:MAG: hypothetical protein RLZZ292_1425 [Bacteroidota bacterium]|jgi:protein involved in polysaccharide export with SLBB domain